ncbi:hypothetical protein [Azospirillum largimobile]
MVLVGDCYRTTEIAREFKERRLGGADTFLKCLQDGSLEAHIDFPSFLPRQVLVPKEVWSEMDDSDLLPAFPARGKEDEVEQIEIKPTFAVQDELKAISNVASAVARRDLTLIDGRYHRHLNDEDLIKDPMLDADWEALIKKFSRWRGLLANAASWKVEVKFSRDAWQRFVSAEGLAGESAPEKPGRKQFEHWDALFTEALLRVWRGEPIKSRRALAEELEKWVANTYPNLLVNARPKVDTIARRLVEIEQRAGKTFG